MGSSRCGVRAILQIFLTGLAVATAITSFAFAFMFEKFMDQMSDNYRGKLKTKALPCVRSTLETCNSATTDKCWDYCCPQGYFCSRSPVVGVYCQDGTTQCGDHNWCRDFADIPRTCPTQVCKNHHTVLRVTSWSFILASVGIVLDLVDIITIFTLPDAVVFKSGVNIFSAVMKFIAFGAIIGAGTSTFLSELAEAKCFNADGMQLVSDASAMFIFYCMVQMISAIVSLLLAPLSAYYGGKLQGVPYVK